MNIIYIYEYLLVPTCFDPGIDTGICYPTTVSELSRMPNLKPEPQYATDRSLPNVRLSK